MRRIILSEEKLNQLADEIGQRLYESRYYESGVIKGEELKDFAGHPQINKFLLFQLFQILGLQINRLKHPYFDFEKEEIQQTLTQLQNQLSRSIKIQQADFLPLVKKAVYNTLKLVLDPVETLTKFFFHTHNKISIETYEKYAPFFSDFDFVVNSILRYHQKNEMKTVEKDIFLVKLQRVLAIYNSTNAQDIESYRNDIFQHISGKTIDEVVNETQKELEAQKRLQSEEIAKAKQEADEAAKAEEEAKRLAESQKQAELAAKAKEEEVKKQAEQSFFDTLEKEDTFFDINDEDDATIEEEIIVLTPTPVETEVVAKVDTTQNVEPEDIDEVVANIETLDLPSVAEPIAASIEAPVVEAPKVETPKIEELAVETPITEEPKAEIPAVETPAVEVPKVETPKIEEPIEEAPKVEIPNLETTEVETPSLAPSTEHAESEEEKPVSLIERFERFFGKKTETNDNLVEKFQQNDQSKNVIEHFEEKDDKPNIAETFAGGVPQQLIDSMNVGSPIKLEDIPIHKQYMYMQRVFGGNNVRFHIIIDKANNAGSRQEIEDIIEKYILNNPDVRPKDPIVEEFIKLLQNRFIG